MLLFGAAGAVEEAVEDSVQEAVEDSVQKENKGGLSSKLSKANPLAATGQTVDVVRWMSNRRQFLLRGVPYGFTGLPVLYFSPNTGWNYGARLHWVDYRRRPYRYKMTLYVLKSSEGSRNFAYRLKVARISGTGFGLRLLLKTKTDLRTRYYGRGNNIEFNRDLIDPDSPSFKDENYYFYVLKAPRLIFSLLREMPGVLWGRLYLRGIRWKIIRGQWRILDALPREGPTWVRPLIAIRLQLTCPNKATHTQESIVKSYQIELRNLLKMARSWVGFRVVWSLVRELLVLGAYLEMHAVLRCKGR